MGQLKKASESSSVSQLLEEAVEEAEEVVEAVVVVLCPVPSTCKNPYGVMTPPDTSVDYTNTNPAYWNSVVSYFKGKPEGNPATGELGIWIPNFEKDRVLRVQR